MIKVPGHPGGHPAIEELTARGVNVNITLLFALGRYEQVIDAYMSGLERAGSARAVARPDRVGGVLLSLPRRHQGRRPAGPWLTPARQGRVASARLAYRLHRKFTSARWERARGQGARPSGPCGRAPAPRTPSTPTSSTSTELIGPA